MMMQQGQSTSPRISIHSAGKISACVGIAMSLYGPPKELWAAARTQGGEGLRVYMKEFEMGTHACGDERAACNPAASNQLQQNPLGGGGSEG